MNIITSLDNTKIKLAHSLKDKKAREELGLFCAEGVNILKDLCSKFTAKYVFVTQSDGEVFDIAKGLGGEIFVVNDRLFAKISDTQSPQGILAIFEKNAIKSAKNDSIFAILEGISDAGNLGTIIRTCVALGITEVFCIDCVDPYSGKAVRASMGAIFKVNSHTTSLNECITACGNMPILALDMNGENIFSQPKLEKFALAVGNEAHGISEQLKQVSSKILSLPMTGEIESLNAAVAMSVALYQLICG